MCLAFASAYHQSGMKKSLRLAFFAFLVIALTFALGAGASAGGRLSMSCVTGGDTTADIEVSVVDETGQELETAQYSDVGTVMNAMTFTFEGGSIISLECSWGTFLAGPTVDGDKVTATWVCGAAGDGIIFTITVSAEAEEETEPPEPVTTALAVNYTDALAMLHTAGVRVDGSVEITGGKMYVDGREAELSPSASGLVGEIEGEAAPSSVIVIVLFYNTGKAEMSARFSDSFDVNVDGGTLTVSAGYQTVVLDIEGYGFRILDAGDTAGSLPEPASSDGQRFLGWKDGSGNIVTPGDRIYSDTVLKPVYASVTGYENCEVHVMNEDNELISVLEEKYGKVDLSSVRIRLLGSEAYSNEDYFSNGWDESFNKYVVHNCTAEAGGVDSYANTHIPAEELSGITVFADTYSGPVRHTIALEELRIEEHDGVVELYLYDEPYLELDTRGRFAYMQGRTDSRFAPEESITRAEAASIIYRCLTSDSRSSLTEAGYFSDVSPVSWYGEAVSMLSGAGLVNGYSDGGFHPNEYITRCEFSAIAVRLLGAGELTRAGLFSDTAGCWAEGYINRAAQLGLVSGYSDGSFRPYNYITRAEAAKLMNAILGRETSNFVWSLREWDDVLPEAWYYLDVLAATTGEIRS